MNALTSRGPAMSADLRFDDALAQRLPLPLAQLYRRAFNAKTPRDRHDAAYYLWEAALKLLGAVAVAAYAEREPHDAALAEKLKGLARPSAGHWWEFVRLLVPVLAESGEASFAAVRELLLAGKPRDDLPRAAGLDAALIEALEGRKVTHSTVRLDQLFTRLVAYRNREIGHGAIGQKRPAYYEKMGRALLLGVADLLGRLDALAGYRLLYVAEVRRRGDGSWLVERGDLSREMYQRAESLVLAAGAAEDLPRPERLYLQPAAAAPAGPAAGLRLLHPLLVYDADAGEVLFLNARRGKAKVEYLSYTSGEQQDRAELAGEQRELLRRVLDVLPEAVQLDAWAAGSAAEDAAGADAEAPGQPLRHLGEFELVSKLGQGGMGIVYRARQPSLGREVALKCLFKTGDPKAEARFAREIRALGRVDHPHLVKVHASGAEGEHWFYAMELVEGTTLGSVCERLQSRGVSAPALDLPTWQEAVSTACTDGRQKEEPLSDNPAVGQAASLSRVRQGQAGSLSYGSAPKASLDSGSYVRHVARLVRQVCAAAQALHEKGIIHRDIKPGNVMVTADGSTAVLMDLGLAQVADEVEGKLTKTRQFVGTLRYASPEQVLAVGRLDARSDVYSLGATLWELLALRPLFGATEQTPTPELMQRIQIEEPGRVRSQNPAVPRDLQAVVEKCLHKDPRQRYGSARELDDDLGRFLDGKPVKARRVTGLERGWKWARRRPALAALAAVLVLATVGLLAGWVAFTVQLDEARREAEGLAVKEKQHADEEQRHAARERQQAAREKALREEADAKRQEAVANEQKARVAAAAEKQAKEAEAAQRRQAVANEQKALAAAAAEKQAREAEAAQRKQAEEAVGLLVSVFRRLDPGAEQKGLSLEEQLVEQLDAAAARLDKEYAGQPLVRARLREALGQAQLGLGGAGKALVLFKQALAERQKHLPLDDPDTLTSMGNLAKAYQAAGQREKALPLLEEVLAKMKAQLGPDHPQTLASMNDMALVYQAAGQLDKALPLFAETLVKMKAKLGPDHRHTLFTMNNLANAYQAAGQLDKALPLLEEVLAKMKGQLGPDHPNTLTSMNNLAAAYLAAEQRDKALSLFKETLAKRKAKLGPDHPATLTSMNNLAAAYWAAGQLDKALPLYEETLAKTRAKLGLDHPNTLQSMNNLAAAYGKAGQLGQALPLYEDALAKRKVKLGPDHPDTLQSMNNLASAYLAAKQPEKALPVFRSYLAAQKKRLGSENPRLAGLQASVALHLLQAGQPAAAEPILRECLATRQKKTPESWATFNTQSMLGDALLGQQKYKEAEPLLLKGYEGMKQRQAKIPPAGRPRLTEALERLVQLYEATDQGDKAAAWRKKRKEERAAGARPPR